MSEELHGTVLCVDDNEDERRALAWVLEAAGLEVEEAATGGEGLRLAEQNPGLVVLDVNLPDIDGFEVCRRIKAHPATAAIPVLHLSGVFVNPDDVSRALKEGADGYLTKPVAPEVLLAWTKALLRTRRPEDDCAAGALSPGGPREEDAEDAIGSPAANGHAHPELEYEEGKSFPLASIPREQEGPRGHIGGEDGDASLGIAVALCVEVCLAVLVVLPLCGVAVPGWVVILALVPTLVLLARCAWEARRGRTPERDDPDVEGGRGGARADEDSLR
jgi:CheY-like chemotaxis protein